METIKEIINIYNKYPELILSIITAIIFTSVFVMKKTIKYRRLKKMRKYNLDLTEEELKLIIKSRELEEEKELKETEELMQLITPEVAETVKKVLTILNKAINKKDKIKIGEAAKELIEILELEEKEAKNNEWKK